ncbi:MAG TPA: hypothetical protein V6C90_21610 [Coleofasciculaceae cyanobacterium]
MKLTARGITSTRRSRSLWENTSSALSVGRVIELPYAKHQAS